VVEIRAPDEITRGVATVSLNQGERKLRCDQLQPHARLRRRFGSGIGQANRPSQSLDSLFPRMSVYVPFELGQLDQARAKGHVHCNYGLNSVPAATQIADSPHGGSHPKPPLPITSDSARAALLSVTPARARTGTLRAM